MIVFKGVSKKYGNGGWALQNISFQVEEGETLVLLGKSGCGKTTAMKMINRLIEPTSGKIFIDGQDVQFLDPIELRRNIGYAVQNIGLFNHMTIEENISIVPKLLKWNEERIDERVEELMELLKLDPSLLRKRYPTELSGGQRQRIGVARALAADPPILLMDEAFAALDPITREQVQNEFLELESDIQKTVVFVTHDLFEAVKMGDRIALMDGGKIIQTATPSDLVSSPNSEFVKQFLGSHQFQLTLMTRTLKNFVDELRPNLYLQTSYKLSVKNSFIEALDMFNAADVASLPMFKGKEYIGSLDKQILLKSVMELLQDASQEIPEEAFC